MKKRRVVLGMAIVAPVVVSVYWIALGRPVRDSNRIRASGNIEVTDAQVSFKIPGRVLAREVSEGDTVRAGQILARLDSTELAQEVSLRRAEIAAAAALLAELEAGPRPEQIEQALAVMSVTTLFLASRRFRKTLA